MDQMDFEGQGFVKIYIYIYMAYGLKAKTVTNEIFTIKINSQSLEDTQVGYISQKFTLDKNTLWKNRL